MSNSLTIATIPLASGGRIGICRLPGITGAMPNDIEAIRAWGAAYLVTMTGLAEMERAGAGSLPQQVKQAGIAWRHFPIVDFGAPDDALLKQWPALSKELNTALDQGKAVLTHCRAGLGRSGMVAMRLLVERGEAPVAALAQIRAVRPGAVETAGQQAWAALPASQ